MSSRLTEIAISTELIRLALNGDEAAQATIYRGLAPAVFALIRRVVGNRAVAEDLFQDTMMALFQRLGDYRAEAPLGAWLRQIAVTRCLMYLRSPWHRARLHWDSGDEDGGSPRSEMLPFTPAASTDVVDVERALAALTPVGRAVVWLFEVEGYSHEEIARLFGRSVSFSKSQLARSLARLRQGLAPQEDHEACTPI
ncbi:MAG TPA: sigma-70 family RNA polymerase sigma factor [Steroidobacteraceae bacterium]|nr:sigma-70 family RNA polymerase sigma factor [Steroidobacteraceae bacterium]